MAQSNKLSDPGATLETISGTVCGNFETEIDLTKVKCPICGEYLIPSGMEYGEDEKENLIMTEDRYRDDFGTPHCRMFGRTKYADNQKIHMSCPNNCVERLTLNIKNVTLGTYREFTEYQR